jgi:hypothetical protein
MHRTFSFRDFRTYIHRYLTGFLERGISLLQCLYLHATTQTESNEHIHSDPHPNVRTAAENTQHCDRPFSPSGQNSPSVTRSQTRYWMFTLFQHLTGNTKVASICPALRMCICPLCKYLQLPSEWSCSLPPHHTRQFMHSVQLPYPDISFPLQYIVVRLSFRNYCLPLGCLQNQRCVTTSAAQDVRGEKNKCDNDVTLLLSGNRANEG